MKKQNDVCTTIKQSIAKNGLSQADHFLVAVSGGVDSMVLLTALKKITDCLKIKLTAVHLDHMYRADAAIDDAKLVCDYCQSVGVICHNYRRPIARLAQDANKSFEEMARLVRYRLFRTLKQAIGANYIVTAHHVDDLAESVLLHLLRGSGIAGLVGIKPLDGDLFRPLLKLTKSDIENYAKQNDIPFNDDISNEDTKFMRNKVRHHLIPQLEQNYNAAIVGQLAQLSDIVRAESDYLAADTAAFFDEVVRGEEVLILDVTRFGNAHTARRRRLIRQLFEVMTGTHYNLTYKHIVLLDRWLQNGVINSRQSLAGLSFLMDRDGVRISLQSAQRAISEDYHLKDGVNNLSNFGLSIILSDQPLPEQSAFAELIVPLDYRQRGLVVRNRQAGDYLRLKGLKGKKKRLKKLLNEQAIAIAMRAKLPLLACASEILWGKGLRQTIYQQMVAVKSDNVCYVYIDEM